MRILKKKYSSTHIECEIIRRECCYFGNNINNVLSRNLKKLRRLLNYIIKKFLLINILLELRKLNKKCYLMLNKFRSYMKFLNRNSSLKKMNLCKKIE